MKRIAMLLGLLALGTLARADDTLVRLPWVELKLPLREVSATELYSFEEGKGYPAVETILATTKDVRWTAGVAAQLGTSVNVPFGGLELRLSRRFFQVDDNDLYFGVWAGRPSDRREWIWGLKASTKLF